MLPALQLTIATELHGINDSGEIVGSAAVTLGVIHGLIYDDSILTLFQEPSAGTYNWTIASGINDAGQIVGQYGDSTKLYLLGVGLLGIVRSRRSLARRPTGPFAAS